MGACQNTCVSLRRTGAAGTTGIPAFSPRETVIPVARGPVFVFLFAGHRAGLLGPSSDRPDRQGMLLQRQRDAPCLQDGRRSALRFGEKGNEHSFSFLGPLLAKSLVVSHLTGQRLHVCVGSTAGHRSADGQFHCRHPWRGSGGIAMRV